MLGSGQVGTMSDLFSISGHLILSWFVVVSLEKLTSYWIVFFIDEHHENCFFGTIETVFLHLFKIFFLLILWTASVAGLSKHPPVFKKEKKKKRSFSIIMCVSRADQRYFIYLSWSAICWDRYFVKLPCRPPFIQPDAMNREPSRLLFLKLYILPLMMLESSMPPNEGATKYGTRGRDTPILLRTSLLVQHNSCRRLRARERCKMSPPGQNNGRP